MQFIAEWKPVLQNQRISFIDLQICYESDSRCSVLNNKKIQQLETSDIGISKNETGNNPKIFQNNK